MRGPGTRSTGLNRKERAVNMRGVNFTGASIVETQFLGADLEGTTFEDALMMDVHFENCRLVDVSFRGTRLSNVTTKDCVILGVDLTGADMDDVSRFHLSA